MIRGHENQAIVSLGSQLAAEAIQLEETAKTKRKASEAMAELVDARVKVEILANRCRVMGKMLMAYHGDEIASGICPECGEKRGPAANVWKCWTSHFENLETIAESFDPIFFGVDILLKDKP